MSEAGSAMRPQSGNSRRKEVSHGGLPSRGHAQADWRWLQDDEEQPLGLGPYHRPFALHARLAFLHCFLVSPWGRAATAGLGGTPTAESSQKSMGFGRWISSSAALKNTTPAA